MFESRGIELLPAEPVISIDPGEPVFFYMNEYTTLFRNFSQQWQNALAHAGPVQIGFNRTLGAMPMEAWLAEHLCCVYFLDGHMRDNWGKMVRNNPLNDVNCEVLAPPVVKTPFLEIERTVQRSSVIGRLAGDSAVPENAIELYTELAAALPESEFWFMPAPEDMQAALQGHPQFRFFSPNEISVIEFLQRCDIYLLTYLDGVPIPGPRSLIEAMAAGCVPVVVNRDGPPERVVHGASGYCFNNDLECRDYLLQLDSDPNKLAAMSRAARTRAISFKIQHWVDKISAAASQKTIHQD